MQTTTGPFCGVRCGLMLEVADGHVTDVRPLCRIGLDGADVHLAIERYMKCGTGHCGQCYVNHRYVCTDGPVFSFTDLCELPDAFSRARPPGGPPSAAEGG